MYLPNSEIKQHLLCWRLQVTELSTLSSLPFRHMATPCSYTIDTLCADEEPETGTQSCAEDHTTGGHQGA